MQGSQNESPSAKRNYGKDTLRPVTIKQLIDARHPNPDADYFMLDGSEMTQVTFVGQIRNVSRQATNVTYKLDDGTGIIEVKEWVDADAMKDPNGAANKPELVEQAYARIWGRLKVFNSKRTVGANIIRPIQDPNEIQHHLLEATAVHLHFSRGPLETLKANSANAGEAANGYQSNGHDTDLPAHFSATARKVYQCMVATPQNTEGLHLQDICIRSGLDPGKALPAAQELEQMGKIFTTGDEHTWAVM